MQLERGPENWREYEKKAGNFRPGVIRGKAEFIDQANENEKTEMFDMISRTIPTGLEHHSAVLDEIMAGSEDFESSFDLARRFQEYSENFMAKDIVVNNSAKDFLRVSGETLLGLLESIEIAPNEEKRKKRIDKYREGIVNGYNFLRKYLTLLDNYPAFEKAELGGKIGYARVLFNKEQQKEAKRNFLTERQKEEQANIIRFNKSEFLARCWKDLSELPVGKSVH